jgi:hypothetical protein
MNDVECAAPVSRLSDTDMQAAPIALLRAARRARELAARTGTPLILFEKGQVIEKRVTDPGDGSPPLG